MKSLSSLIERISSFSLVFVLCVLWAIGVFLIPRLDVTDTPRATQGKILTVSFYWNNIPPHVLEQEVTSKIEGAMAMVKGVKEIRSESFHGMGRVLVELKKGENVSATKFEISSILRQMADKLPQGCSYPSLSGGEVVNESSSNRQEHNKLLTYRLHADLSIGQMKEYAQGQIKPWIERVEGVKWASVSGFNSRYLEIEYNPMELSTYGLSAGELVEAIRGFIGKSSIVGDIILTTPEGEKERATLLLASLPQTDDIGKIALKKVDGKIIYLNNLASFVYKNYVPTEFFRINGMNTIYINVYVDARESVVSLSRSIQDQIQELQPLLKEGVHLELIYDAAKEKRSELEKLLRRMLTAISLLLLFVWLSKPNAKYLFCIVVSLISNLLIAIIFYYIFDIRLHTIVLAGITISFGLIIDSSIIMTSHYAYYRNRKAFISIFSALLTTAGTMALVFFLPEHLQKDLVDFAIIVIINLTVAMLVALFFIPALINQTAYYSRKISISRKRARLIGLWNGFYIKYIQLTQHRKWICVLVLIVSFGIPIHLLPNRLDVSLEKYMTDQEVELPWYKECYNATLGSSFFITNVKPHLSKIFGGTLRLFYLALRDYEWEQPNPEIKLEVKGKLPMGGTAGELNEKVKILEAFLLTFEELERFETEITSRGAVVKIEFKPAYRHTSFPHVFESKVVGELLTIGGADWSTMGVSKQGFSNSIRLVNRNHRIDLTGYNYNRLSRYTKSLADQLSANSRISDLLISVPNLSTQEDNELYVDYNKEKLALYKITPQQIHALIESILSETPLGKYSHQNVRTDLIVRSGQQQEFDLWNLKNTYLHLPNRSFPLTELLEIKERNAQNYIAKRNQEYQLSIHFNAKGSYLFVSEYLQSVIEDYNRQLPVGYRCVNGVDMRRNDASSQYLLLGVAIALVFIICSILFESLSLPLALLCLIPISFMGVFVTFYITGAYFGTGGLAAMVMLSSMVVNAAIYIINEYRQHSQRQSARSVQLFVKAYNHKILSVILTMISTVLALIPFLWDREADTFWYSFAMGIVGGLCFALPAIVFILPIFLSLKEKKA